MWLASVALLCGCGTAAEVCAARGGRLNAGIAGEGPCVFPTKDGGKPCHDKADCEFACWAPRDGTEPGTSVTGECAPWPIRFGCHADVSNGIAGGTMCVD